MAEMLPVCDLLCSRIFTTLTGLSIRVETREPVDAAMNWVRRGWYEDEDDAEVAMLLYTLEGKEEEEGDDNPSFMLFEQMDWLKTES